MLLDISINKGLQKKFPWRLTKWVVISADMHQALRVHLCHDVYLLQWIGFIKDYDGGTLVECRLNPKFCYTDFTEMMKRQKTALDGRVRKQSNSHVIHDGLKVHCGSTILSSNISTFMSNTKVVSAGHAWESTHSHPSNSRGSWSRMEHHLIWHAKVQVSHWWGICIDVWSHA